MLSITVVQVVPEWGSYTVYFTSSWSPVATQCSWVSEEDLRS